VDPPEVIVLPPIPDTPEASEEPQNPAEPAAPAKPVPAPPAPPAQPNAPLQPAPEQPQQPPKGRIPSATADEIIATMKQAKLRDCLITVSGANHVVVARGLAHARLGGSSAIVVRVGLQPKGHQ